MTNPAFTRSLGLAAGYGIRPFPRCVTLGPRDGLRFVHAQIATTVLPRRLDFRRNGDDWLSLSVASRRLLTSMVGPQRTVFTASTEQAAALATLRDAILAGSGPGARLSVHISPDRETQPGARGGVTAELVAAAFDLGPLPHGMAWFELFLRNSGEAITCAALLDGDLLYPLKGSEAEIDGLVALADQDLPEFDALPPGPGATPDMPCLLLLDDPEGGTRQLLGRHFGLTLLARSPAGAIPPLLRGWYALL